MASESIGVAAGAGSGSVNAADPAVFQLSKIPNATVMPRTAVKQVKLLGRKALGVPNPAKYMYPKKAAAAARAFDKPFVPGSVVLFGGDAYIIEHGAVDTTGKKPYPKGSFGYVKRAVNVRTGEKFAYKKVRRNGSESTGFALRNLVELCLLTDTACVISEHTTASGKQFVDILTRWHGGGDLFEQVNTDAKILAYARNNPIAKRVIRVLHLLRVLSCVHLGGYIHHDLKEENILLSDQGEFFLHDFGLAMPHDKQYHSADKSRGTVHTMDRARYQQYKENAPQSDLTLNTDFAALELIIATLFPEYYKVEWRKETVYYFREAEKLTRPTITKVHGTVVSDIFKPVADIMQHLAQCAEKNDPAKSTPATRRDNAEACSEALMALPHMCSGLLSDIEAELLAVETTPAIQTHPAKDGILAQLQVISAEHKRLRASGSHFKDAAICRFKLNQFKARLSQLLHLEHLNNLIDRRLQAKSGPTVLDSGDFTEMGEDGVERFRMAVHSFKTYYREACRLFLHGLKSGDDLESVFEDLCQSARAVFPHRVIHSAQLITRARARVNALIERAKGATATAASASGRAAVAERPCAGAGAATPASVVDTRLPSLLDLHSVELLGAVVPPTAASAAGDEVKAGALPKPGCSVEMRVMSRPSAVATTGSGSSVRLAPHAAAFSPLPAATAANVLRGAPVASGSDSGGDSSTSMSSPDLLR